MASSGWLLKDSNSVGGGSSGCCYLGKEEIHKSRKAAVAGVKSAAAMKAREVNLEDFGDSEAAGKGAALAFWVYQRVKKETIEQWRWWIVWDGRMGWCWATVRTCK